MGSRHFIFFDDEYWMNAAWISINVVPTSKGWIHPWYVEQYHRVRIREQQAKLKELVEDNKQILQELAAARLKADQIRLSALEKTYKKELTKLLRTIIEIKADIRRSEELLVLAICSRKRLRMGMIR